MAGAQNYMNGVQLPTIYRSFLVRREKQVSLFSRVAAEADGCHMQEAPQWHCIPSLNPVSAIAASGSIPQHASSNLAQEPAFLLQTHTV